MAAIFTGGPAFANPTQEEASHQCVKSLQERLFPNSPTRLASPAHPVSDASGSTPLDLILRELQHQASDSEAQERAAQAADDINDIATTWGDSMDTSGLPVVASAASSSTSANTGTGMTRSMIVGQTKSQHTQWEAQSADESMDHTTGSTPIQRWGRLIHVHSQISADCPTQFKWIKGLKPNRLPSYTGPLWNHRKQQAMGQVLIFTAPNKPKIRPGHATLFTTQHVSPSPAYITDNNTNLPPRFGEPHISVSLHEVAAPHQQIGTLCIRNEYRLKFRLGELYSIKGSGLAAAMVRCLA